jgi:hypothetical protein
MTNGEICATSTNPSSSYGVIGNTEKPEEGNE